MWEMMLLNFCDHVRRDLLPPSLTLYKRYRCFTALLMNHHSGPQKGPYQRSPVLKHRTIYRT